MEFLKAFVTDYGTAVFYAIVTGIAAYLGTVAKRVCDKFLKDRTVKTVVRTCVRAVEQIYKDLHGEEKLNKALEAAVDMLESKGITNVSEFELKMLIEASVSEFNDAFNK